MPENLKVRGYAWSGRAEREGEQAALGVWMVVKDVCVLPMDSLETIGQSTLAKAS